MMVQTDRWYRLTGGTDCEPGHRNMTLSFLRLCSMRPLEDFGVLKFLFLLVFPLFFSLFIVASYSVIL